MRMNENLEVLSGSKKNGKVVPSKRRRSILVDCLSVLFGLGSWIAMTGLWVELPLLVQRLPDGWTLASRLTLTLQIANIGPVVYGLFNTWFPDTVTERLGTHVQLALGAVSTLLLIFFWTSTVSIGGSDISLALYILCFGLSIVDCTSSVVFLPYMANFRALYLVPYLLGEGFSGLLPSLVAMAQGIDDMECVNESFVDKSNVTQHIMVSRTGNPNFEPEWFFAFLLVMVLTSWIAFWMLDTLRVCKQEMLQNGEALNDKHSIQVSRQPRKNLCYYYLLAIQGFASVATFGVFPAIQPYSCLPYGDKPFHYAVTLGGLAYPVSCFVSLFWEVRNVKKLTALTVLATTFSVFILYTAVTSPTPPLVTSPVGAPLVVICWVLFVGLFSYVKTMVTVLLGDQWGSVGLFWCGAVTQAGAALGAMAMFLAVNFFDVFSDNGLCF